MPSVRVAVSGGGIASLCLAGTMAKLDPKFEHIQVDVYESAAQFSEVGVGLTLWGRVCEALHLMGYAAECIKQAVIVADASRIEAIEDPGFALRESNVPHQQHGELPLKDAWSLHRADLQQILLRKVPKERTHLNKRVTGYQCSYSDPESPITVQFSDGTTTQCDILIGGDGLRSTIRGQLMRDAAEASYVPPGLTGPVPYHKHIHPRNTGTIAYRSLIDAAVLRKRNPSHPMLKSGQAYLSHKKHIVGYPISSTVVNIGVNVTPSGFQESTSPTSPKFSVERPRSLTEAEYRSEVLPLFSDCDGLCTDLLESIRSSIEWPIMDLEPPPLYVLGRVAIMGDAAHATVPYVGAGAAFAIEDAFVLSRVLYAAATSRRTPRSLEIALSAYQTIRLPYGNRLVIYGRRALRDFQLSGPSGTDAARATQSIMEAFTIVAEEGDSPPNLDVKKVVELFKQRASAAAGFQV